MLTKQIALPSLWDSFFLVAFLNKLAGGLTSKKLFSELRAYNSFLCGSTMLLSNRFCEDVRFRSTTLGAHI